MNTPKHLAAKTDDASKLAIPAGYKAFNFQLGGPFMAINGPLLHKHDGKQLLLGMRVEKRHCNPMDVCHGGMLMSFVDMAMPMGVVYQENINRFLPTISLNTDFLAPVPLDAWLEARTDVLRVTRSMVFAQCLVQADGITAVRASGVFKLGAEYHHPAQQ